MMNKTAHKTLEALHEALTQVLLTELQSATPDPKVMAVARGFLNDNGITLSIIKMSTGKKTPHPLDAVANSDGGEVLPFPQAK